ncbi:hypothetical protein ACH4TV_42595 [Streptomyces sp. NPDC020898]|uniref:hypothetical protein n=1 Tax=Streptomyces sp. NPDC020898 TaxID=3365101 RepID=UPI0037AAA386
MVASLAVLTELDSVGDELSEGYRKTKCLQEDHPVPGGSFEEIQVDLNLLWERYRRMRSVMRRDLQINDPPLTSPADPS